MDFVDKIKKVCGILIKQTDIERPSNQEVMNSITEAEDSAQEERNEYILELAQERYEYENKREDELVSQSGRMQAAFSFITAALFMVLPVLMEHKGKLSDNYFFWSFSAIIFFLLASLVLSSLAAWRWNKNTLGSVNEIEYCVKESSEWFSDKNNRMEARIEALKETQVDRERINDRRVNLIRASMISFFCSIATIVICYIVAVIILFFIS